MNSTLVIPNLIDHPWHRVGLGTWKSEPPSEVTNIVYNAIKIGYRHIDCAATYGNEKYVGQGIIKAIDEGIVAREDLWITSKLWCTDHAPQHVEQACRRTLKDLQLDYIDLYLIHFPVSLEHIPHEEKYPCEFFNDPKDPTRIDIKKIPLSVTWNAMEKLVDKKLARYIGVSNFELQLLQDLLSYARIKPITNQVELHPYLQQKRMVRFCENMGMTITSYSPLGGKSYRPLGLVKPDEIDVMDNPVLQTIAKSHQRTVPQVILRWILQLSPNTVVIPKTISTTRAKENIKLFDFILSKSDMENISDLDCGRRYNDLGVLTEKSKTYWPIFA